MSEKIGRWLCRIGWHQWRPLEISDWYARLVWPEGRECCRCSQAMAKDPYGFWVPLNWTD